MPGKAINATNVGAFVPTTNVWDVTEIYEADLDNDKLKELLIRLYQNLNKISINLNLKDTGYYDTQEFVNGQKFFPNPTLSPTTPQNQSYRQNYRMIVNCGPITASTTYAFPHNISVTNGFSFTRIYGVASVGNMDATLWGFMSQSRMLVLLQEILLRCGLTT